MSSPFTEPAGNLEKSGFSVPLALGLGLAASAVYLSRPSRLTTSSQHSSSTMAPKGSVEIAKPAKEGETGIRRSCIAPDALVTSPAEGVEVLSDIFIRSARLYPTKNAVGWRDVVKMHKEQKEVKKTVSGKEVKEMKTWEYFELSGYQYWTYSQFADEVAACASGLHELGLTSETRFNIYSSTKPNWQLLANACARQGITFATAYDSLGEEGLQHSLNEPEVVGLFTNANLLSTVAAIIGKTTHLKYLIYDGEVDAKAQKSLDAIASAKPELRTLSLSELTALGKEHPHEPRRPSPDDVACLMYTSGSSGPPKGVVLTHRNVVASVAGVMKLLGHLLVSSESYIAYLPLAHILEFIVEMSCLFAGVPMGYGTVKTLTDASVRNCLGDIREFRPSIMVGVPAVWELIRKGIVSKVKGSGKLKETVFNGALTLKKSPLPINGVLNAIVFNQVKQQTGGKLRYALSGGAALSKETQEFLTTALVTVLQGYGLTESCGMCAILPPDFMQYGSVGVPVPSVEVKLVDVAEANYFATNNPPQGEVWIRGPSVTKGYFKLEETTKESITDDGWFKTGDVAQWNEDGTLTIIDRKKNLVKLAGGEYIALERLESIYKSCDLVSNICVHADSSANRPMAIVFPHEKNLEIAAKSAGLPSDDFNSLCNNSKINDLVLKEVNSVGKKAGFKALETLQCIILTSEEWTPQNGLLTAASKLQRKVIMKTFDDSVKKYFTPAKLGRVLTKRY